MNDLDYVERRMLKAEAERDKFKSDLDEINRQLVETSDKLTHVLTSMDEGSLPWWQQKHDAAILKLATEIERLSKALQSIAVYPVHSETAGGAYAMQDIAQNALEGKQ